MRKVLVCLAGVVIAGMLLVPPWVGVLNRPGAVHVTEAWGYYPVWAPPRHEEGSFWGEKVDYGRLGLQVGAVVIGAGVLMVVLPGKRKV